MKEEIRSRTDIYIVGSTQEVVFRPQMLAHGL